MSLILISAMARKSRAIGNENGLPWNDLPDEYQNFLEKTEGHPVIMGRKTYDILVGHRGQDYEKKPDSKMFVVSRSVESYPDGVEICKSLEEAIEKAKKLDKDVFVAGGESMYRQALPMADKMYLSYVDGDYEGTAYFPEFSEKDWRVTEREEHRGWEFVVYERILYT